MVGRPGDGLGLGRLESKVLTKPFPGATNGSRSRRSELGTDSRRHSCWKSLLSWEQGRGSSPLCSSGRQLLSRTFQKGSRDRLSSPKRHDLPGSLVKGPRMSPFYRWENRGFGSSNSSTGLGTYLYWLNFTDPGPGVLVENT